MTNNTSSYLTARVEVEMLKAAAVASSVNDRLTNCSKLASERHPSQRNAPLKAFANITRRCWRSAAEAIISALAGTAANTAVAPG